MPISEWDTLPDGTLDLLPLLDARVAKSPLQVFARLQFARLQGGRPQTEHIQLGMTPAQAQQLVRALQEAIDRIEREDMGRA